MKTKKHLIKTIVTFVLAIALVIGLIPVMPGSIKAQAYSESGFLWDGYDGSAFVNTNIDNESNGSDWYVITDSADGGKSKVVFNQADPYGDGSTIKDEDIDMYSGISGTAVLDKGTLDVDPYVYICFDIYGKDEDGSPMPADISNCWDGLAISYMCDCNATLELGLGDAVDSSIGYANPYVDLKANDNGKLEAFKWAQFRQPSWHKADQEISIEEALDTLVTVKIKIQAPDSSGGTFHFMIDRIGTYGSISSPVVLKDQGYIITYEGVEGASFENSNPDRYTIKDSITLNNPSKEGYEFAGWTGTGLDAATTSVTIPEKSTGNRVYTATWTPIDYDITKSAEHGTFTVKKGDTEVTKANYNDTLTLTATPDTGYEFVSWTVKDKDNNDIPVTDNTFTMPAGDVNINAEFGHNYSLSDLNYGIELEVGDTVQNDEAFRIYYGKDDSYQDVISNSFTITKDGLVINDQNIYPFEEGSKWYCFKHPIETYGNNATLRIWQEDTSIISKELETDQLSNDNDELSIKDLPFFKNLSFEQGTIQALRNRKENEQIKYISQMYEYDEKFNLYSFYVISFDESGLVLKSGGIDISDIIEDHENGIKYLYPVRKTYKISKNTPDNGSFDVLFEGRESSEACPGEEVTINIKPDFMYELDSISVKCGSEEVILSDIGYTFIMPDGDVEISAEFKEREEVYNISKNTPENGSLGVSVEDRESSVAWPGAKVKIFIEPDQYCELGSISVKCKGNDVALTSTDNGFEFTMPEGDVNISAEFKASGYIVTFKVENGTWEDESADDIVILLDFDKHYLTADQIPSVGKNPKDHYKEGAWDTEPTTSVYIDKNTVFTYTYKYIEEYEIVSDKISKLHDAQNVSFSDNKAIDDARKAYDALSEKEKSQISEDLRKKLTDVEAAFLALVKASKENPEIVNTWAELKTAMAKGGAIKLGADITDTNSADGSHLVVESGNYVILDLNGHTIDRALTADNNLRKGYVIYISSNSTLDIYDTQTGGKITGGYSNGEKGGGIYISSSGTLNMYGGTITGNTSVVNYSGGGGIYNYGTFNMFDGTITGNNASGEGNGGGIYNDGIFNMYGGIVSGNHASHDGNDLYTYRNSFLMTGGTIEDVCNGDLNSTRFTLSFDKNGGTGSMTEQYIMQSVPATPFTWLKECEFNAPMGKKFIGWSFSENGAVVFSEKERVKIDYDNVESQFVIVKVNEDGTAVGEGIEIESTTTLYAIYTDKETIDPTIVTYDWTYGDTVEPEVEGNLGEGDVTYTYSSDGVNFSEERPFNAGNYIVKASIEETEDYKSAEVTKAFSILRKPITITAGSATKVYDGTELTDNSYTVSENALVKDEVLSEVTLTGSRKEVGSSANVASGAEILNGEIDVTANYDITYVDGTLTVTEPAEIANGYYGDPDVNGGKNVTWVLDEAGTLTISGSGQNGNDGTKIEKEVTTGADGTKIEREVTTRADGSKTIMEVITDTDGSKTTKEENKDSNDNLISSTVKKETTDANGTKTVRVETKDSEGNSKVIEENKGADGSSMTSMTLNSADGYTVKSSKEMTDTEGNVTKINETRKYDEKKGITTDTVTIVNQDKTTEKTVRKTQDNGNYTETGKVTDENGTVIETSTAKRKTSTKTGAVTESRKVKNGDTTTTSKVVTEYSDGKVSGITLTETATDGTKTTVKFAVDEKSGNIIISSLKSTSNSLTVPGEIVDADGVSHSITSISRGMIDKSVKVFILGKNVKKVKKNAIKGYTKLRSIICYPGIKFYKGSLSGTSGKLKITLLMPEGSTKKARRAAREAVEKQLKNAGNPNVKVKTSIIK